MGRGCFLKMAVSKQCILEQLMDMIAEMRSVPQSKGVGVACVHGKTLYDPSCKGHRVHEGFLAHFRVSAIAVDSQGGKS